MNITDKVIVTKGKYKGKVGYYLDDEFKFDKTDNLAEVEVKYLGFITKIIKVPKEYLKVVGDIKVGDIKVGDIIEIYNENYRGARAVIIERLQNHCRVETRNFFGLIRYKFYVYDSDIKIIRRK